MRIMLKNIIKTIVQRDFYPNFCKTFLHTDFSKEIL